MPRTRTLQEVQFLEYFRHIDKNARKRLTMHPKYYLFDTSVVNAINGRSFFIPWNLPTIQLGHANDSLPRLSKMPQRGAPWNLFRSIGVKHLCLFCLTGATSVLRPLSSVLCPLSSVLRPLSSDSLPPITQSARTLIQKVTQIIYVTHSEKFCSKYLGHFLA